MKAVTNHSAVYDRILVCWLRENHPGLPKHATDIAVTAVPTGYDGEIGFELEYMVQSRWFFVDLGEDLTALVASFVKVAYKQGCEQNSPTSGPFG